MNKFTNFLTRKTTVCNPTKACQVTAMGGNLVSAAFSRSLRLYGLLVVMGLGVMKSYGTTIPCFSWNLTGIAGFSSGTANYTSIARDASGIPYVVYQDVANGSKATVMKFDGATWSSIGTGISGAAAY